MEVLSCFFSLFFLVVGGLISMAFITLLEQKVLGSMQIRVGPVYAGFGGLLQPVADAVKLLNKELVYLRASDLGLYLVSPAVVLSLSMIMWGCLPGSSGASNWDYSLLFFMVISGLMVYPVMISGWASNCKYSLFGSLRGVAQTISYEISLCIIALSVAWFFGGLSWQLFLSWPGVIKFSSLLPVGLLLYVCVLAETNRSPYDFAEGESELVSGFNTEYGSSGFTLIFMGEYLSIVFMSVIISVVFLVSGLGLFSVLVMAVVGFLFIWVRASVPRLRYDMLMDLAWKVFLPISLFYLVFYYWSGLMSTMVQLI